MEALFYLFLIILAVGICLSPFVAIMAYMKGRKLEDRIQVLQRDVGVVRKQLRELTTRPGEAEHTRTSARASTERPAASRTSAPAAPPGAPATEGPASGDAERAAETGPVGPAAEDAAEAPSTPDAATADGPPQPTSDEGAKPLDDLEELFPWAQTGPKSEAPGAGRAPGTRADDSGSAGAASGAGAKDRGGAGAASGARAGAPGTAGAASGARAEDPGRPGARSGTGAKSPGAGDREADEKAAARTAVDFETLIGSTWLLRIGLGVLAIALALFARSILPQLSAPAKVGLAYAGAIALFGTGKYFEDSLERFARPVMAAGLSFGFFVAFAAHFVPAMSAVGLTVSIVWMVASMGTVLVAAERWQSQWTAALAIVLGHISVFVTAGAADIYSLVMIAFLALTAGVLTLRHKWLSLGLFAITASYGSHLLWLLAERAPISGDVAFWLNLSFLTVYYVVFLIVDVLWWKRDAQSDEDAPAAIDRIARQIGPANLVLYASLTSFAYISTGAGLDTIEWFYLTLGTVQGVLAWYYWSVDHRDYVFYPAFGTVLWTLGWFAALDALALNLVLAAQALLLLLAANHTRLLVFHALAQVALLVAFLHYLVYPVPTGSPLALLLGGIGIAGVYLLKASLEEVWYGEGSEPPWTRSEDEGREPGWFERTLRDALRPVLPHLAKIHAAMGGMVLVRELNQHLSPRWQFGAALVAAGAVVAALALFRRRSALLFAVTTISAGGLLLAESTPDAYVVFAALGGLALLAIGLAHFADSEERKAIREDAAWHGQIVVGFVLAGQLIVLPAGSLTLPAFVAGLTVPALVLAFQERLRSGGFAAAGSPRADPRSAESLVSGGVCAITALVVFATIGAGVGPVAVAPLWVAGLSVLIAGASLARGSAQLFLSSYVLLVMGYLGLSTSPVLWSDALTTIWIGPIVTLVPMALALLMDRTIQGRTDDGEHVPQVAGLMTYLMFGLGLLVVVQLADANLGRGWSLLAPAMLGVVMVFSAKRANTPRATPSVVALFFGLHLTVLAMFTGFDPLRDLLSPLLMLSLATLMCDRGIDAEVEARAPALWERVRIGLVVVATITAMAAIYESSQLGVQWATAGWSVLGISLMAGGFGLRSAVYRRVALAVLAVCLVRVFLVDTQGLSDTARTAAFGVLGLSLVGVAWLYSRFSEELKSWL